MIRAIGWVNPWPLQSWLYRNRSLLAGNDGVRRLKVSDGATVDRTYDKVRSVHVLMARAEAAVRENGLPLDIIGAEFEQLDPGAHRPWSIATDFAEVGEPTHAQLAVHVGLVSSPGAMLYSRGASWCVLAGQVVLQDLTGLHSAVNYDEKNLRIHLVIYLARREAVPLPEDEP